MIDQKSRSPLKKSDPAVYRAIQQEVERQQNTIDLIASENIASSPVLEAAGSVLTNKYAEGYAGRRYYGGCRYADEVEDLAVDRLKRLFNASYANVQPHSGASANLAAFLALLTPGDTFLGMSLAAGGHLTHGSPVTISGKWFKPVAYGVQAETGLINYDEVEALTQQHKPKLIIAGGSAYSRIIDFKRFRQIADSIGAYLMVDMAHFSGLVAGGVYPNPLPFAHVVTSTTHKTLRGPRGGIILSNDVDLGGRLSSAVFPGAQGGPLMHIIAAKAVAFEEALRPEFKHYVAQVVKNAQTLCRVLKSRGFELISGGTDTHLVLVDVRSKNITGAEAEAALERAGIICNKNSIPNDPSPPRVTSGIRIGTPTITTRGFGEAECEALAGYIADVLEHKDAETEKKVSQAVQDLCRRFPIYTHLQADTE